MRAKAHLTQYTVSNAYQWQIAMKKVSLSKNATNFCQFRDFYAKYCIHRTVFNSPPWALVVKNELIFENICISG